ncbi:MFS transporter, partial [Photobacterium sanctipauli]
TAIINSGAAFGMAFGLIGSSYLVKNVGVEWHYLLFFIVALLAVIIGLYALILKNKEPVPKQEPQQAKTPTNQRSVLFSPVMISAYIMYFATNYGYYMIVTWLPSYLQLERGFEGFAIGFASALVAIAAIPGALYFSRMSDKYRDKKVKFIISLELAAAVTLVLTVLAPNTTILMVSLMLYGLLGKLAVEPIIISFVADNVSKSGYGTTFSLFNFFGMSSAVITPYLTGFISDMTGSKVMSFYLSAFFIIVGTCVFFAINRKKTPELKTA